VAAKNYTNEQKARAARSQLDAPLDSDIGGVRVAYAQGTYSLDFAFSPAMANLVRCIPGAAWDKEQKTWLAPSEEYEAIKEVAARMRDLRPKLDAARVQIEAGAAKAVERANIAPAFTSARVTKDNKTIQPRTTGPIVAMNDHYIAQSTGKNYVTVHDRAVLADSKKHSLLVADLIVGQVLSVGYYNGAGLLSPARTVEANPSEPATKQAPTRQQRPYKQATAREAGPSQ
jgi:hypothetical protein